MDVICATLQPHGTGDALNMSVFKRWECDDYEWDFGE